MNWQDKVALLTGESIVNGKRKVKGHLGQTEILSFTIVNEQGEVVGNGEYTEHTNVRGLQNSFTLNYSKKDGIELSENW